MRVSSSSRFRIAPNSRAISASVSSVLVYSRSCSKSRAFSIATATCAPNWRSISFVGFGELAGRVAEQVQRADHAPLAPQRHDQLRVRAGHRLDVARIGVDVVDENRLPFGDRRADQAVADLQPQRPRDIFRIADRVGDRQLLAVRIEQVDGKRLELRQPRDELRDLVQQLVEVEHRRDFAAKREQRR